MGRAGAKAQALAEGGSAFRLAAASCPAHAPDPSVAPGFAAHDSAVERRAHQVQAGLRAGRATLPESAAACLADPATVFAAGNSPPVSQTSVGFLRWHADPQRQGQDRVHSMLRLQPPHIPDPPIVAANVLILSLNSTPHLE